MNIYSYISYGEYVKMINNLIYMMYKKDPMGLSIRSVK